jgi:hypothetical protein
MQGEVFKELNAHIRACDSKSLVVNGGYLASLLFVYSDKSANFFLSDIMGEKLLTSLQFDLVFLVSVVFVGYGVLFVQLWFRGWKVHYMSLLHEMWKSNETAFEFAPIWMKSKTPIISWDNMFRLVPFFTNAVILFQISFLLDKYNLGNLFVVFIPLAIVHFFIAWASIKFGESVSNRRA